MKFSVPPPSSRLEILDFAGSAVAPLARWMVRSGIGYRDFCLRLKRVYLLAAVAELERQGAKQTETALCALSGLHRKDVHALMQGMAFVPSQEGGADDRAAITHMARRMFGLFGDVFRSIPHVAAGELAHAV